MAVPSTGQQMSDYNPYQSPREQSAIASEGRSSASKNQLRLANRALWLTVFCLVMYLPLAGSTVWVGLWHGHARSYAAMDWVCNGLAAAGLMGCIVSGVLGTWLHRVTALPLAILCCALLSNAVTSILGKLGH